MNNTTDRGSHINEPKINCEIELCKHIIKDR